MNTSKQTVTGAELIDAFDNFMKILNENPERISQEEMIEISNAIQKIKDKEAPCVGCGDKEIAVTECGGETGVNMCAKCFGTESDEEEAEFTCDTCDCELDPNDLIEGFHDKSVYQCADCFDADEAEDNEDDEEDDIFCGGCGFTPCVEPEDPMDMRLCERCYKDSIAE